MTNRLWRFYSLVLLALLCAACNGYAQRAEYDFVIMGARVVDGTGAPAV